MMRMIFIWFFLYFFNLDEEDYYDLKSNSHLIGLFDKDDEEEEHPLKHIWFMGP